MAHAETMQLRGFDSYRVSLGDELRGERASLGKSLLDVQRDLRIKAAHIDAIENANPAGIPHQGYVTGYVRTYARYLGLDEEQTLSRFCEEAGFVPPAGIGATATRTGAPKGTGSRGDLDAVIAGSRLAAVSRSEAMNGEIGATLRGLTSLGVLLGVLGGLGYGGWLLLENIQRVDFSPIPQAPTAQASAPSLASPMAGAAAGPTAITGLDTTAIAAVYALQELPPPRIERRDGPISTINPRHAGIYGHARLEAALRDREALMLRAPDLSAALPSAGLLPESDEAGTTDLALQAPEPVEPTVVATPGVALVIEHEAWLRVRDASGRTVHEALMQPGSRWDAPGDGAGLVLRAGNAAGVFIEVAGQRYGPLGRAGQVVSGISLAPDAVRAVFGAEQAPLTTSSLSDLPARTR